MIPHPTKMAETPRGGGRMLAGMLALLPTCAALACEPITSVPATLDRGVYCLAEDVTADEGAFVLQSDATLDCQGHAIKAMHSQSARPVTATGGDNIEVRNCVFQGFIEAIEFWEVTHYRITGNTFLDTEGVAVLVSLGRDGVVSGNTFRYPATPRLPYQSDAINITTDAADVRFNSITGAISRDGAGWNDRFGIWVAGNDGGVIANNLVRGLVQGAGHARISILSDGGDSVVYRNVVANPSLPDGSTDVGLVCEHDHTTPLQNIIIGHVLPYEYCYGIPGKVGAKGGSGRR
jgi:hypothetical protein